MSAASWASARVPSAHCDGAGCGWLCSCSATLATWGAGAVSVCCGGGVAGRTWHRRLERQEDLLCAWAATFVAKCGDFFSRSCVEPDHPPLTLIPAVHKAREPTQSNGMHVLERNNDLLLVAFVFDSFAVYHERPGSIVRFPSKASVARAIPDIVEGCWQSCGMDFWRSLLFFL